jgi:hypothetical protein
MRWSISALTWQRTSDSVTAWDGGPAAGLQPRAVSDAISPVWIDTLRVGVGIIRQTGFVPWVGHVYNIEL